MGEKRIHPDSGSINEKLANSFFKEIIHQIKTFSNQNFVTNTRQPNHPLRDRLRAHIITCGKIRRFHPFDFIYLIVFPMLPFRFLFGGVLGRR
jgi:hypothetical protein